MGSEKKTAPNFFVFFRQRCYICVVKKQFDMETIALNNNDITILDELKAESLRTGKKISEIVSPSGDEWFDDEENLRSLERGIQAADRGELVEIDVQALLKEIE